MAETNVTTISEFKHDTLKANVAIVGNHHRGSEAYMASLKAQLDRYQTRGSVIHYENLQSSSPQEVAREPLAVQRAYADINYLLDVSSNSQLADVYDLVPQGCTSWTSHDMTALELAKHINARPDQRIALRIFAGFMRHSEDEPSTFRQNAYDLAVGSCALVAYTALTSSTISARNKIALKAVGRSLAAAPDQDITMLWGQAHVRGIARGLARQGFRLTNVTSYNPNA